MKIAIDQTGFDQHQKNMTHAMIATLLHERGIKHDGISRNKDGSFEVATEADVLITSEDILQRLSVEEARQAEAEAVSKTDLAVLKERIAQAGSMEEVRVIFTEVWPAI